MIGPIKLQNTENSITLYTDTKRYEMIGIRTVSETLTSYLPMLFKKHMLTDPIDF